MSNRQMRACPIPPCFRYVALLLPVILLIPGCDQKTPETGIPAGWTSDGPRWWRAGIDTTGLFRDMETLRDMGVAPYTVVFGVGERTMRDQVIRGVQIRLLALYRNRPEVVDSLFHAHVVPRIRKTEFARREPSEIVDRQLGDAYRILSRHFREPRAVSTIGEDIPFAPRPDSLAHLSGTVRMQVHVDSTGATNSVQLLEGVHPVLNAMAMAATARMEWTPAYLHGEPISSWARFRLSFEAASS